MTYKYDVFISYRRNGGSEKAQLIKSEIKLRGVPDDKIFLDTHSLHNGDFAQTILNSIKNSSCVVVVISKGCFDEIKETDFWYMEIREALAQHKLLVPVFFDGIVSFDGLNVPLELQALKKMNAVTYQHDYADAAFNKLFEFLAIETSYSNNHENKGLLIKYRGCLISITLVALIFVIVSPLYLFDSKDNSRFNNENILSEQCIRIEDSIIPRIPNETSNSNHSVNSTVAKTETKKETNMNDSTNMLAYTLPELNVEGKVRESYVPQQVNDASDGYSNLIIRKQIPTNILNKKSVVIIQPYKVIDETTNSYEYGAPISLNIPDGVLKKSDVYMIDTLIRVSGGGRIYYSITIENKKKIIYKYDSRSETINHGSNYTSKINAFEK